MYEWDDHRVLKLFHSWVKPSAITAEQRHAQAAHRLGLPTPNPGEIIEVRDRSGIVYERVHGPSLAEHIARSKVDPRAFGRLFASLHAEIHAHGAPRHLPGQREQLAEAITSCSDLTEREREQALTLLSTLPTGNQLCHGDFHPANVLLPMSGPITIDWLDATCGNPAADVARTSIICLGFGVSRAISSSEKQRLTIFHENCISHYVHLRPDAGRQYPLWLPIVAAARLTEGITKEKSWLVHQVRTGLA